VDEIPDKEIQKLGWILRYVPVDDLGNFTLNEVDTIASLGQFRNLTEEQVLVTDLIQQLTDFSSYSSVVVV